MTKEQLIEVRDCFSCNQVYYLINTDKCPQGHDTIHLDTIKAYAE